MEPYSREDIKLTLASRYLEDKLGTYLFKKVMDERIILERMFWG